MNKRNKLIYWIATAWLSLGMISTGLVQVLQREQDVDFILRLGYPMYFLWILGTCKLLGVIAILIPRYPLLKEWAYSGFFFMMVGALFSHLVMHSPANEIYPSLLLLLLIFLSWYFRPAERTLLRHARPTGNNTQRIFNQL